MGRSQALPSCYIPEPSRALNPSTSLERRPRKGHKKSRQGCYECKRRKIKCQETRPKCDNCVRVSLKCRYLPEVAAIANRPTVLQQPFSSLQVANVFSLTDMRLFHHFLVAAFPHLPVRGDNVWLSYLTPIGHQHEYLMHAMLALSASHLNKLGVGCLTLPAQTHRLAAIKGLNETLERPLSASEEGDAAIATCYALLMQSWYMDDGLQASLILTRSCDWTRRWVKGQRVKSLLAADDEETRFVTMRGRLKDVPRFDAGFVRKAVSSLESLRPLCMEDFQVRMLEGLKDVFESLVTSPMTAYRNYVKIDSLITELDHESLIKLLEPSDESGQLLLAHLVALHLVMRPLSCRERKQYTVTMYSIRMNTWIPSIHNAMREGMRGFLKWPMWVAGLHVEGRLERWSLAR